MRSNAVLRAAGALLVTFVASACSSPAGTAAPSITATTKTTATAAASASGSSPTHPSGVPSQAVAAVPFDVTWKHTGIEGIGPVQSIVAVAMVGDTRVLVASLPYLDDGSPNAAAWWSTDGISWTKAQDFPASDSVFALTAGGPGLVAGGFSGDDAGVWTSTDGRAWHQVSDPSLKHGVIRQLLATDAGIVAFGFNTDSDVQTIWTSSDGTSWLAATNATGVTVAKGLEAAGSYGGRAIAFVSEGDKVAPSIWETRGRAEWVRTGTLPDVASIERVAGGGRGWVALSQNRAWTSTDGITWGKGVAGPDVDAGVIVDDAGFVATGYVGSLPGETCGDQRPFAGHTWTSADGRTWQRMPVTTEFEGAFVTALLVVDRNLIGYGQVIAGDGGDGLPAAAWSDRLPPLTAPGDASDVASLPKGCGD